MARLVLAVQELSLARDLPSIQAIVRRAARELTDADGATFVLRDEGRCYYADEDAISPLWKGQRFPMSACISGWVMLNRQHTVIPDIYQDPRIPVDAYRPTFVKSLVMVPIRTEEPIGAIGNYWAHPHEATADEISLLQALASSTAVAMENVQVYSELERRVENRTRLLAETNRELEAFSYSVSHDLRAPLRAIHGFTGLLKKKHADSLPTEGQRYLDTVIENAERMGNLIEDLLRLAHVTRAGLRTTSVDLSQMAREIVSALQATNPGRGVEIEIADRVIVSGDAGLLRAALENLLSNAWKYSSRTAAARIEFGVRMESDGGRTFFVRDNGAGFDMAQAERLFAPFQRLHSADDFPGTGVGLATVQRVIRKHGGRIWAEAETGRGATFFFTLS